MSIRDMIVKVICKDVDKKLQANLLVGEVNWISVDDKMPETNDLCWIKVEYINMNTMEKLVREFEGEYIKDGLWICHDTPILPNHAIKVTHWFLRKGVK